MSNLVNKGHKELFRTKIIVDRNVMIAILEPPVAQFSLTWRTYGQMNRKVSKSAGEAVCNGSREAIHVLLPCGMPKHEYISDMFL